MSSTEIILEMYRAMRAGDDDAFFAISAEDLVWQQSEGFPGGSTWHGPAAVIENVFQANSRRWIGFAFNEEEILENKDGSRVMVLGHYSGVSPDTNKPMRTAVAHVYDVVGGKISRFRMYADTQPMWAAMKS